LADYRSVIRFIGITSFAVYVRAVAHHTINSSKQILRESDNKPGTLFGAPVLLNDWRVEWLQHTLAALEKGLPVLTDSKQLSSSTRMPPSDFSLSSDTLPSSPYTVLLVDRPEKNAFSFGWSVDTNLPQGLSKQGVICVFTGLLDSILGEESASAREIRPEESKQLAVVLSHETAHLVRLRFE
jgi:hypothetical protein